MTWTIRGGREHLLMAVTKSGYPVIRGVGVHEPPIRDDPAGWALGSDYEAIQDELRRLQTVQTDWRILPSDAKEDLSAWHKDLLTKLEAEPGHSIAEISCRDDEPKNTPTLSFLILLKPAAFQHVHRLFTQLLFHDGGMEYSIFVGFTTFRLPGAHTATPTLQEFMARKPYFSDAVSVQCAKPTARP